LPTNFFLSGVTPWRVSPGAVAPPHTPSDATGQVYDSSGSIAAGDCLECVRRHLVSVCVLFQVCWASRVLCLEIPVSCYSNTAVRSGDARAKSATLRNHGSRKAFRWRQWSATFSVFG